MRYFGQNHLFGLFASVLTAAILLVSMSPVQANAQTVLEGQFEEGYSGEVAVSGRLVVGAILGSIEGVADLTKISIPRSHTIRSETVCLYGATRDGVYWTRAKIHVPDNISLPLIVRSKDDWKYLEEVKSYSFSDLGVLALIGEDCDQNRRATILPITYDTDASSLTIMVNSQRALSINASLTQGGEVFAETICERSRDASVRSTAFNVVCRFDADFDQVEGQLGLQIQRRLRIGARTDEFAIDFG